MIDITKCPLTLTSPKRKRLHDVIWNTSDGIIIPVPNIWCLKSRFFPSFIYNTFTYYNTPTRLVPTLQKTNKQNKIQEIVFTLTNTLRRVKIVSGLYYRPKKTNKMTDNEINEIITIAIKGE